MSGKGSGGKGKDEGELRGKRPPLARKDAKRVCTFIESADCVSRAVTNLCNGFN